MGGVLGEYGGFLFLFFFPHWPLLVGQELSRKHETTSVTNGTEISLHVSFPHMNFNHPMKAISSISATVHVCTWLGLFERNIHTWFELDYTWTCLGKNNSQINVFSSPVTLELNEGHWNWQEGLTINRSSNYAKFKTTCLQNKNKNRRKNQRKVFTTDSQTFIHRNTNLHELSIQAFLPLPPPPPKKKKRLDVFSGLMYFLKKQTKTKNVHSASICKFLHKITTINSKLGIMPTIHTFLHQW